MSARLGWFFCECAFRLWTCVPAAAYDGEGRASRWRWRTLDSLAGASYDLGCAFYRRAP